MIFLFIALGVVVFGMLIALFVAFLPSKTVETLEKRMAQAQRDSAGLDDPRQDGGAAPRADS